MLHCTLFFLIMVSVGRESFSYRRHVYLLSGEAEQHSTTVYLLDK